MARSPLPLTGDLKKISECSLYRDPRVSSRARFHTFCRECKEKKNRGQDSCPLCRSFLGNPYEECGSFRRNFFMEKLVDLHQANLERKLNLKGEQIVDIPLVERFKLKDSGDRHIIIARLENKFYVTYPRSSTKCPIVRKVHVFADRAPFEELEEPIEMPEMNDPQCSASSADTRSIFFGEAGCIWRIQMPEKESTRLEIDGELSNISITPNSDLLAGVSEIVKIGALKRSCELNLFNLTNASRKKIPLPERIDFIDCVVQSQNENFIISYTEMNNWKDCFISILSNDGANFIKNVDTRSFRTLPNKMTLYSFAVKEDGQIFVTDCFGARVLLFNSDFTGCRDLSTNGQPVGDCASMIYIPEKQQLFVHAYERISPDEFISFYSVFHLSRCDTVA